MNRPLMLAATLLSLSIAPAHASPKSNKALVIELYARVFNDYDLSVAERLLAPDYIQHHPGLPSGRAAFIAAFKGYFTAVPTLKVVIKRTVAEGDLVVVHSLWKNTPDARGDAVVDIYRVANGRIVEHWDVVQPVPADLPNPETMF